MFELTSRAATALAETRVKSGLADGIAIRISVSQPNGGPCEGYQLRFAAEPLPNDEVISTSGATVFLAAGVADRLAGSVLDSEKTANGSQLVLKHRPVA